MILIYKELNFLWLAFNHVVDLKEYVYERNEAVERGKTGCCDEKWKHRESNCHV